VSGTQSPRGGQGLDGEQVEPLFEPGVIALLESLTLGGRRVPAGRSAGQWRSRASGSSVEFSDYRTYTHGDDFRRIDWNAYARLERLFVRLYRAEEDLALTIHLDASASMGFGTGSGKPSRAGSGKVSKGRLAAQLAGALAFVALQSGDRVSLVTYRGAATDQRLAHLRGQASTWPAWRLLENLEFDGATDLNAALANSARHLNGAGLSVIISDLFSPNGYQQGIDALLGRRQDVLLVHLLSPDEIEPPADMIGEWRLVDAEPAAPLQATITPGVLRSYKRLLNAFIGEADEFCRRRGITYLLVRSDMRVQDILMRSFRTAGVLV
jgi:uncharacterized protein (DUF58 family)